jgi:hypothetical protein
MDPIYHSFLVRFWTSEGDEPPFWHISLESAITKEVRLFANLEDLTGFFKILMRLPSRRNPLQITAEKNIHTTESLPDKTPDNT